MASPSAYNRFKITHRDALNLIPANGPLRADSGAAHRCRFGLVLGVASMDSYFTTKFMNKLTSYIKKRGSNEHLEELMRDANIDTAFFLDLLRSAPSRPFRIVHANMKKKIDRYTSQSTHKIDKLFLAYGIKDLSKNALAKAKSEGSFPRIHKPKGRLNEVIQRRHKIVHANDYNSRNKYRDIDPIRTRENLLIIKGFVDSANKIIDSSLKGV